MWDGLTANQTCWEDSEKHSLVIKQLYGMLMGFNGI
jgi:hypothetical protein